MLLGRLQKCLLWRAATANNEFVAVTRPGMSGPATDAALRAVHVLANLGLVEIERRKVPRTEYPRVNRLHMRITALGDQVAETFSTPLQTGGRIRWSEFEARTGLKPPRAPKQAPWLVPGAHPHHRVRQQRAGA